MMTTPETTPRDRGHGRLGHVRRDPDPSRRGRIAARARLALHAGFALLWGLAVLVAPAPAAAEIRIYMEWTGTSSTDPESLASLGTPDYVGMPGDLVSLTLYLGLNEGDWVSAYGVSIEWDTDFGDELDLLSISEVPFLSAGGALLTHITPGQGFVAESDIETIGTVQNFEASTFGLGIEGRVDTGRLEFATVQFELTETLASDGDDIEVGFFDTGVDEVLGCPAPDALEECVPEEAVYVALGETVSLEPASVSPVPEPAAVPAGLCVLLAIARLRRRRRTSSSGSVSEISRRHPPGIGANTLP